MSEPETRTETSQNRVPVLFIGGFGRSGSTLLELMLSRFAAFVPAGEIRYLWWRGVENNELCGCGRPFGACDFWSNVLEEAFGSLQAVDVAEMRRLWRATERIRYIPQLRSQRITGVYRKRFSEHAEVSARVFEAIASVSGRPIVVDSSKVPSHGFCLHAIDRLQLYVVHLVRDSRAVAYSWQKKKRKLQIHDREAYMRKYTSFGSAVNWLLSNTLMELLRQANPKSMLLRYEDLTTAPEKSIAAVCKTCEIFLPDEELAQWEECGGWSKGFHALGGNPMRFESEALRIRPDTVWKEKMSARRKAVVAGLTWPMLLKYGYLGFGREKKCSDKGIVGKTDSVPRRKRRRG